MFNPLSLFIGLRYTRTRKRNLILSFVSLMSTLGISIGVLAMIVVLSVINGSTAIQRNETLKFVPHAIISSASGDVDWPALTEAFASYPGVLAAAPFIEGEAWIRYQGRDTFIRLRAVDPKLESAVSENSSLQFQRLLDALAASPNGIIMGARLASDLQIFGTQTVSITPLRSLLRRSLEDARNYSVVGVADFGFYDNDNVAVISLDQGRQLFGSGREGETRVRLRVEDVFQADSIARNAVADQPGEFAVVPWSESQRTLFDALRMEKYLTGFMLLMIVIIGAVNIISTLVMVVADKGNEIAILRTMGAGKATIMKIFMIQGTFSGLLGVASGALLGTVITANLDTISRAFENALNRLLQPDNVYRISYLRADLIWSDVLIISLVALLISFLATLYPAYRASRVHPAEVLRYE